MNRSRIRIGAVVMSLAVGAAAIVPHAQDRDRLLELHFIDVEGGAATLIATPAGESVLLDAGWGDVDGRDARRIQAAMRRARVERIDYLITSHYHVDHYGGVPDLAGIVEVRRFYDHGSMSAMKEDDRSAPRYAAYRKAARDSRTAVVPGFSIDLAGDAGSPRPVLTVHRNVQIEAGLNTPPEFIANLEEASDEGHAVVVTVNAAAGTFTVRSGRHEPRVSNQLTRRSFVPPSVTSSLAPFAPWIHFRA